jgi:hypothetical protein
MTRSASSSVDFVFPPRLKVRLRFVGVNVVHSRCAVGAPRFLTDGGWRAGGRKPRVRAPASATACASSASFSHQRHLAVPPRLSRSA